MQTVLADFQETYKDGKRREPDWISFVEHVLREPGTVHETDALGRTPLHVCAYYGKGEYVRLLAARGACVGARDAAGVEPLHLCAWGDRGGDANVTAAAALLDLGASALHAPRVPHRPLFNAVYARSDQTVRLLLESGCPAHATENRGGARGIRTPLCVAVELGLTRIALTLVALGGATIDQDASRPTLRERFDTRFDDDARACFFAVEAALRSQGDSA